MSSLSLKKVDAQGHATAFEAVRVILAAVMGKQLFPHDMPKVSKERRVLTMLLDVRIQEGHVIIFEFDRRG